MWRPPALRACLADAATAHAWPTPPPRLSRSEDLLFLLYTSGSTGRPKGVAHTTAGYLLYTMLTCRYTFDLREGDVFACVADCGCGCGCRARGCHRCRPWLTVQAMRVRRWVTGHSYIVYGPLANGATTVMFESTPLYPDHGRYWDLVQRHRVTQVRTSVCRCARLRASPCGRGPHAPATACAAVPQLYTAPTAIRALMRHDPSIIRRFDLSSLRVLGTVGEPINPEVRPSRLPCCPAHAPINVVRAAQAWRWYYHNVGQGRCAVVDTFWQTETCAGAAARAPGRCSPRARAAAGTC